MVIAGLAIYSCKPQTQSSSEQGTADSSMSGQPDKAASQQSTATADKGKGKFTDVKLTHPLDQAMVTGGKSTYEVKCAACHRLSAEKLVGPGWKGVTDRRKPEWIMNFVTNTDEMIDKDAAAQAMLEQCMVRMPNQHLNDGEARSIFEFMRNNDGKN